MSVFTAVIFDMDGLMFDTERLAVAGWVKAARSLGFELPEAVVISCIGLNERDSEGVVAQALGSGFPYARVRELEKKITQERVAAEGVPLKPGLERLMDSLDLWKIPMALATSTSRERAEGLLDSDGLGGRFAALVFGDQVEKGKPHPEIFLTAACRLGASPGDCLVLEDSEMGLIAGVAAGMRVIVVPDLKPPGKQALARSLACLADLGQVQAFLHGLIG